MAKTYVSGEEFVKKVLDGERDFHRIHLEEGLDLNGSGNFGEIQQYLRENELEDPLNLESATIKGLKANGMHLPYLRASNATIYNSQFSGAHLPGTDFSYSTISGCNFDFAKLWNASLAGTNVQKSQFKETELNGAKLNGSTLSGANFKGAELVGADFSGKNEGRHYCPRGASIIGANFSNADLRNADFSGANLYTTYHRKKGTNFKEADLTDVQGLERIFNGEVINLDEAIIDTRNTRERIRLNVLRNNRRERNNRLRYDVEKDVLEFKPDFLEKEGWSYISILDRKISEAIDCKVFTNRHIGTTNLTIPGFSKRTQEQIAKIRDATGYDVSWLRFGFRILEERK